MWLALLLGIASAVALAAAAEPVVRWLGGSAEVAPYAVAYLRASLPGLPGVLVVLAATGVPTTSGVRVSCSPRCSACCAPITSPRSSGCGVRDLPREKKPMGSLCATAGPLREGAGHQTRSITCRPGVDPVRVAVATYVPASRSSGTTRQPVRDRCRSQVVRHSTFPPGATVNWPSGPQPGQSRVDQISSDPEVMTRRNVCADSVSTHGAALALVVVTTSSAVVPTFTCFGPLTSTRVLTSVHAGVSGGAEVVGGGCGAAVVAGDALVGAGADEPLPGALGTGALLGAVTLALLVGPTGGVAVPADDRLDSGAVGLAGMLASVVAGDNGAALGCPVVAASSPRNAPATQATTAISSSASRSTSPRRIQ